jgi:hypothetical protein
VEAVRLINGKECLTLELNDLAGLIQALCDAPLDGEVALSAELLALRHEVAKALGQEALGQEALGKTALADAGDGTLDAEALTAVLAAVLSGSANEAARRTFAELVARSAASRLDAESALALVETIERSAETAPAHLIAELIEARTATAPVPRAAAERFWWPIANRFRHLHAYRVATACAVALLASAATWSLSWRQHEQLPPAPLAKTESVAPAVERALPAVADTPPLPAAPALAVRRPCEPQAHARQAFRTRSTSHAFSKAKNSPAAGAGCDAAPADDADAAIRQTREDAERARQNAAVPEGAASSAAAAAPSAIGTTRSDPMSGAAQRPATTFSAPAPAAKPTTRPLELSR